MPGYGGKSKEYPRVHVDIGGLIVASAGPHRYDLDLVRRYEEAIGVAEGKRSLLGSPDTPVSNLKSRWERDNAANDPPARGHRQAMEAIIEAVNGPGTLVGVEVALTTGGVRADYIVQIGVVQRFVEVKAWKTINLEGRSSATTKFMDQVRGYVTEAQARGKQQGGGLLVYEVHLQFRTEHEDIDRVRELVDNEVYIGLLKEAAGYCHLRRAQRWLTTSKKKLGYRWWPVFCETTTVEASGTLMRRAVGELVRFDGVGFLKDCDRAIFSDRQDDLAPEWSNRPVILTDTTSP